MLLSELMEHLRRNALRLSCKNHLLVLSTQLLLLSHELLLSVSNLTSN